MKKKLMCAVMICMLSAVPVMGAESTGSEAAVSEAESVVSEAQSVVSGAESAESGAESVKEAVITWNEEMEQAFADAGFSGSLNTIDALGLELLVPEGLTQRQPTDEEKETDTILVFENEDQSQRIEFVLGPLGECETLDDVMALLNASYPDMTVTPTRINEYSTLVFGNEEKDSMTVLINAGDAGFLRIICHPMTETSEMNQLFSFVAASIQQIKE